MSGRSSGVRKHAETTKDDVEVSISRWQHKVTLGSQLWNTEAFYTGIPIRLLSFRCVRYSLKVRTVAQPMEVLLFR